MQREMLVKHVFELDRGEDVGLEAPRDRRGACCLQARCQVEGPGSAEDRRLGRVVGRPSLRPPRSRSRRR